MKVGADGAFEGGISKFFAGKEAEICDSDWSSDVCSSDLKTLGYDLPAQFDRIAWEDAFDFYGSDKPDLRFDLKMQDAAFMAGLSDFNAFKAGAANADKSVERHKRSGLKALVVKNVADKYSRKNIEALETVAKINHAKGLAWMKVGADGAFEGGISKFFAGKEAEICAKLGAEKNDLLLFVSDEKWQTACAALGAVRKQLGKDLSLHNPNDEFHFAWIIDFPYFAWNEDESHWETEHHMFTLPQKKYWPTLESDPGSVKGPGDAAGGHNRYTRDAFISVLSY